MAVVAYSVQRDPDLAILLAELQVVQQELHQIERQSVERSPGQKRELTELIQNTDALKNRIEAWQKGEEPVRLDPNLAASPNAPGLQCLDSIKQYGRALPYAYPREKVYSLLSHVLIDKIYRVNLLAKKINAEFYICTLQSHLRHHPNIRDSFTPTARKEATECARQYQRIKAKAEKSQQ